MVFFKPICLFITIGLLSLSARSHPVAFADSIGIMGHHAPIMTHNQVNYSFKHWFAAGVHHFRRPNLLQPTHATLASANFLLKRWNGSNYQANIYGVIGAGQSELSGRPEGVGMGILQFDIEDREYYFLARHLEIHNDQRAEYRQSVVRVGLAPYQGRFDDIHSWLILEWQNNDFVGTGPQSDITPYLRLFYQNLLFEIGQSFRGITRFNYIVHF